MRLLFLLFSLMFILAGAPVRGDEGVVEGAKKEGKLVAYVSMNVGDANILLQEFKKKYPFIDTQLYRANTQKLLPKIEVEARAKKHEADIISATFPIWNELKRKRLLMPYKSPEGSRYGKGMKDPEGYWTALYLQVQGMAYNTRLVPSNIAPGKYEDLLNPRWKPKEIAMDYRDSSWFAVMLEIMGEGPGLAFMRTLSEKDLYLRENKTLLTQLLAAGEFPVLANTYLDTAMGLKKAGAPIEWVPGRNPIPTSTHLVGIYAYPRHPSAARLYIDFVLSREGQALLTGSRIGKYPVHPDAESDLRKKTAGFKLHPINPAVMTRFDEITKQFMEIFWKN